MHSLRFFLARDGECRAGWLRGRIGGLAFRLVCQVCCLGLVLAGCSKHEEAGDPGPSIEVPSAPANAANVDPASPAPVAPIGIAGDSKETVSSWSEVIKSQLKDLAKALVPSGESAKVPVSLAQPIRVFNPDSMKLVELHRSRSIKTVEIRSEDEAPEHVLEPGMFLPELRRQFSLLGGQKDAAVKFKLFAIQQEGKLLKTRQRVMARGTIDGGPAHVAGVVDATWTLPGGPEGIPQLAVWSMPSLVRNEMGANTEVAFDDIAGRVLGGNAAWNEQLRLGMNTWRRHIDRSLNPDFVGYHGLAVGDVDGDGLEDLYLCQPGGLPNLLFRQESDGTMVDISKEAGVDWLDNSTAALLIDLDNDGDADLALATRAAFVVMENDGAGRFSLVKRIDELGMGYSPTAADYDLDGDLDLLVLRYAADGKVGDFPTPHPFHSARNGGSNRLLQNQGGFQFVDVTETCGLDSENYRFSFAASWEDYDNDGDGDLYIANDFGPNQLFRNDGGRLVDVSQESGTQDWGFGMSATWADYDRDGRMDLYVSSMFSGAGNQVVAQSDFNANLPEETRSRYLKMVRGNTLLRNSGGGVFEDVTEPMTEGFGGWAWGAKFADFDNDGWEDLYVANGYISQPDTDDL